MEVTIGLLEEKYDEYNDKYFNGQLKSVKLGFVNKSFKNTVGEFEFYIDKKGNLRDTSIKINKGIDWDEEKLRRVLLHEMIHLSLAQKYKKGKGHGLSFIRECKRVEEKYNVNVWHCWMRKGYTSKRNSIATIPLIMCYDFVSFIKFRIVQKVIYW